MSRGIIVCGYPGVGKSSIAGWENCIDLESSIFHEIQDADNGPKWEEVYCMTAINLASQGFTVMTSTHRSVVQFFYDYAPLMRHWGVAGPFIFCPKKEMKWAWIDRVSKRFQDDQTDGHFRAYERVRKYFDDDIDWLTSFTRMVRQPDNIDYDLKDYIQEIRRSLEIVNQNWPETDFF